MLRNSKKKLSPKFLISLFGLSIFNIAVFSIFPIDLFTLLQHQLYFDVIKLTFVLGLLGVIYWNNRVRPKQ
jgi:hypothetical protein